MRLPFASVVVLVDTAFVVALEVLVGSRLVGSHLVEEGTEDNHLAAGSHHRRTYSQVAGCEGVAVLGCSILGSTY